MRKFAAQIVNAFFDGVDWLTRSEDGLIVLVFFGGVWASIMFYAIAG